jgi:hypothetical protein
MTIEQRLEQLELQNQRIERKNKRLTAALAVMAVAMCAVVTMAATGEKVGRFDKVMANAVMAENILVMNDAGKIIVALGATTDGGGVVTTFAPNGKELVELGASDSGGMVTTYAPNGKKLVRLGMTADTGGSLRVFNKTGEGIAVMRADEYGNGVVGAYNRKGMGRTLKPGP